MRWSKPDLKLVSKLRVMDSSHSLIGCKWLYKNITSMAWLIDTKTDSW